MRAIPRIALLFLGTAAANAQDIPGCVLATGYERAEPPLRRSAVPDDPPPGPRVRIESLRRGFDDGTARSCSNAGVLELVINPRDVGQTDIYSFEIADGSLPEGLLPERYVEAIELRPGEHGFRFYWLDLPPGAEQLQPLDAVIRIQRTNFAGQRSSPVVLEIADPGGTPASTARLWNSTWLWAGVAAVLLAVVWLRTSARRRKSGRRDELAEIQARLRELANEKKRD